MVARAAVRTLICSCLDGRPPGVAGVALALALVPRICWLVILVCMGVPLGVLPAALGPATLVPAAPAVAAGMSASGTTAAAASTGTKRLMNELRMIRSLRRSQQLPTTMRHSDRQSGHLIPVGVGFCAAVSVRRWIG